MFDKWHEKRKRGKNNGMKSVRDTTYGRMFALNISNKEKREYVKIRQLLIGNRQPK